MTIVYCRNILRLLAVVSLSVMCSAAQRPRRDPTDPRDNGQQAPFTFRVPVDVVVVNATVLDKQGSPVKDLTVDDFKVYDDGKIQTIHTFSLDSYRTALESPPSTGQEGGSAAAAARAAPESRSRYLCFFVDDLVQPSIDLYHPAMEAVKVFLTRDLRPGDQVSMTSASGLISYPFASDRQTLLGRANEMEARLNHRPLNLPTCPELSDLQAFRIVRQMGRISPDAPEFFDDDSIRVAELEMLSCDYRVRMVNETTGRDAAVAEARRLIPSIAIRYTQEREYRAAQMLDSLRRYLSSLRFHEGNKSLILLSGGFYAPETQYSLQEVIEKALRSGITVNTVDVRGVYTTNTPATASLFAEHTTIAQKMAYRTASLKIQEGPLAQMAADTGGYFYHGNNDLHLGLQKIAERQTCNYVLSYAPPLLKNDGRYHKIRLVVNRPDVQVSYRQGYYAPREEVSFVRRKKEDILEALRAPGDISSIPVQLSYSTFRMDDSHYQVSVQVRIDIRPIKFADEGSRHDNLLNILTVASDETGRVVDGLEKAIDFKLTDSSYENMLRDGLNSQAEITLPPGRYRLQAVVREGNQAKMGSRSRLIEVP